MLICFQISIWALADFTEGHVAGNGCWLFSAKCTVYAEAPGKVCLMAQETRLHLCSFTCSPSLPVSILPQFQSFSLPLFGPFTSAMSSHPQIKHSQQRGLWESVGNPGLIFHLLIPALPPPPFFRGSVSFSPPPSATFCPSFSPSLPPTISRIIDFT